MSDIHSPGRFLAGVAGVIRNRAGAYLLLKRSASRDFNAGVWECVTGRVNQGEGFEQALHREVAEETGLRVRIDLIIGLSHFYRGEAIIANELQGLIFGCAIDGDETVHHGSEHSEYLWAAAADALAMLTARDAGTMWLRNTITRAEAMYAAMPEAWPALNSSGVTMG